MNAIKHFRIRRNLAQHQLAEQIHCQRSTIAAYESGAILPSAAKLKALSKALKTSTDSLLQEAPDIQQQQRLKKHRVLCDLCKREVENGHE